nr:Dimethyl sulfoxide/trimethylamine N-oxide reductaseprecursor [Candidatus Pantoea persica]
MAGRDAERAVPAAYDLYPADRLHSQLDATPTVQGNKTAGHETLYMHPQDAAARGSPTG